MRSDVASYVGYSGGWAVARDFSQVMLEERARVLGPEHQDTLYTRGYLAHWTGMAGNAARSAPGSEGRSHLVVTDVRSWEQFGSRS
ncbi:MAG TPA: hypothetical protein VGI05_05030 [Streptosporangiaceae bacterium]